MIQLTIFCVWSPVQVFELSDKQNNRLRSSLNLIEPITQWLLIISCHVQTSNYNVSPSSALLGRTKLVQTKPSGGNVFKAFEQRMATWKSFLFLFVFLFLLFQRPRNKNFIKNPKCNTVLCNTSQRQCH